MGSERKGRGGGWRTLQKGDQERDITVVGQGSGLGGPVGHHHSTVSRGQGRRLPHSQGGPRGQRQVTGSCGYPLLKPCPSAWPTWSRVPAVCGRGPKEKAMGPGPRAGHLAMALGGSCAAHCALPAAPVSLGVLTPTSSPRGSGNPQTVAIQTCSGTTYMKK